MQLKGGISAATTDVHTRARNTNLNTYKHEYTFLQHNSVHLNIINLSARFSVALGRFWEIPALSQRKAELKGTDERNSSPTLLAEVNIIVHPAAIAFYSHTLTILSSEPLPLHSPLSYISHKSPCDAKLIQALPNKGPEE